tara:strand:- start:770 stop:931 length:162 start_codon:yes stop_codon:yes gene_type:complete
MARYYFYTKTDSTMEAIYTTDAQSIEEATIIFSIGKDLSLESFSDMYEVKIKN